MSILLSIFDEVEKTQDCCAGAYATPVCMLVRVQKVETLPGAIGTLDDDRS